MGVPRTPPEKSNVEEHMERVTNSSNFDHKVLSSRLTYSAKAKVQIPGVILEFVCSLGGQGLSTSQVADFLFEDLRFSRTEIRRLRLCNHGYQNRTIRVQTFEPIDIRNRFRSSQFSRRYGEHEWVCSIAGCQSWTSLKLLNVPEEVNDKAIEEAIGVFAKIQSNVEDEVFGIAHDQRLKGIANGNKVLKVELMDEVPDTIVLMGHQVRLWHRDQVKRCYHCKEPGHIIKNCKVKKETRGSEGFRQLSDKNRGKHNEIMEYCEVVQEREATDEINGEVQDHSVVPSSSVPIHDEQETTPTIRLGTDPLGDTSPSPPTSGVRERMDPRREIKGQVISEGFPDLQPDILHSDKHYELQNEHSQPQDYSEPIEQRQTNELASGSKRKPDQSSNQTVIVKKKKAFMGEDSGAITRARSSSHPSVKPRKKLAR